MTPITKWTIWQRRWAMVWWSLGAIGLIAVKLVFYPTFSDKGAALQKSFEGLPTAAVQLLGGSTDFFSPVGFLNGQIFFFLLPLLLSILAIGLGAGLVAREEQDGTIESLLARPVARGRLLAAKSLAGKLILLVVTGWALVTTVGLSWIVGLEMPVKNIALTMLACFLLVLSFGAVAFLVSALGRARAASVGIASALAFGGYLVSSLAGTVDWLVGPSKLFAFHYYQPEAILRGTYSWKNALYFVAVIVLAGLLSWLSFRTRDIG